MFTYALWDISKNKTLFNLEKIFSAFSNFNDTYPKASWSANGTQFAFVGEKEEDVPTKFELFLVMQNGDTKQLTNLSDIGYVWPSSHSWSPNNDYIAFFVSPLQTGRLERANIFIVNTNSLEVTDLCISVGLQGASGEPVMPIWSPSGNQFMVVDRYEIDRQRVLLVDIEKKVVFPIAENAEPIGWMLKP
jgi:Tol biopolymer transport system component